MVSRKSKLRRFLTVELPMIVILLFTLGPYLWMMLTSLTQEDKLFTQGPSLIGATFENYIRLFETVGFLDNMITSFIVAAGTVVVGLTLSVTAAYSFSRFRFFGKKVPSDAVSDHQYVSDRAADPASVRVDARAGVAGYASRPDHCKLNRRHSFLGLDDDQLYQWDPQIP